MSLLPKSAFAQTVLLIGALLLVNQIVSYLSVTYYFIQPSYQQINALVATQVDTLFDQDIISDDKRRQQFSARTGIQFLAPVNWVVIPKSDSAPKCHTAFGSIRHKILTSGSSFLCLVWVKPIFRP